MTKCEECNENYYIENNEWCKSCNSKHLQNDFEKLTANNEVKKFFQKIQNEVDSPYIVLEWISYNELKIKNKIEWERNAFCSVALKSLNYPENENLLYEIEQYTKLKDNTFFVRCFGISQNSETKAYIMKDRIKALLDISNGLEQLHECNLTHQDFHSGNLLFSIQKNLLITNLSLCEAVNEKSNVKYGVVPYMAPELLFDKKTYTAKADIYSFGMIMYFIATGNQPFANYDDYYSLAKEVKYNNFRSKIKDLEIPESYIKLIKKCWASNPDDRPIINDIKEEIRLYYQHPKLYGIEKAEQYLKANEIQKYPQIFYRSKIFNSKETIKNDYSLELKGVQSWSNYDLDKL
ncbi:kinase-like domain-containing protein [Rhizophagus clarus]|uniref:Kinase-like domain-containing protein n=1 Tax=Rhizophagus clarus TaxID=94130 RepID=A0A8H3LWT0_9GLOM|nr:kinase-like domain-containing protein [Rhizophagus clarus]